MVARLGRQDFRRPLGHITNSLPGRHRDVPAAIDLADHDFGNHQHAVSTWIERQSSQADGSRPWNTGFNICTTGRERLLDIGSTRHPMNANHLRLTQPGDGRGIGSPQHARARAEVHEVRRSKQAVVDQVGVGTHALSVGGGTLDT